MDDPQDVAFQIQEKNSQRGNIWKWMEISWFIGLIIFGHHAPGEGSTGAGHQKRSSRHRQGRDHRHGWCQLSGETTQWIVLRWFYHVHPWFLTQWRFLTHVRS